MKPWLECLMKEPAALQDFIDYCKREEDLLIASMEDAIEAGKMYHAASLVGQRKQFAKMRTQLNNQLREEQQYVRFEEAKGARKR